jgi:hypothetical protein
VLQVRTAPAGLLGSHVPQHGSCRAACAVDCSLLARAVESPSSICCGRAGACLRRSQVAALRWRRLLRWWPRGCGPPCPCSNLYHTCCEESCRQTRAPARFEGVSSSERDSGAWYLLATSVWYVPMWHSIAAGLHIIERAPQDTVRRQAVCAVLWPGWCAAQPGTWLGVLLCVCESHRAGFGGAWDGGACVATCWPCRVKVAATTLGGQCMTAAAPLFAAEDPDG